MKTIHAHAQIQYENEKGGLVESLFGFDPRENRAFIHSVLDEYLDELSRKMEETPEGFLDEENLWNFQVFGYTDK